MWLLYDFLFLKNDVNVISKTNEQKNLGKIKFLLSSWRSLTKIPNCQGSAPLFEEIFLKIMIQCLSRWFSKELLLVNTNWLSYWYWTVFRIYCTLTNFPQLSCLYLQYFNLKLSICLFLKGQTCNRAGKEKGFKYGCDECSFRTFSPR